MQEGPFGFQKYENTEQLSKHKVSSSRKEKGLQRSPENAQKELRKILNEEDQFDIHQFQKLFQEILDNNSFSNDEESPHSTNKKEEESEFDMKVKIKGDDQASNQPNQESEQNFIQTYPSTNVLKKLEQGTDSDQNDVTKKRKKSFEEVNLGDKGSLGPRELPKQKTQELEKRNKVFDQEYDLLQNKIKSSLESSQINLNNFSSQNSININSLLEEEQLVTRKSSIIKNMPQNHSNNNNILDQKTDLIHEMFQASDKLIARLEKEKKAIEKTCSSLYEKCNQLQTENEILKYKLETFQSLQKYSNKYFGHSVQILEEKLRTAEKTIEKLQSEKETLEVKLKSLELVRYDEIKKHTWLREEHSNEIIRNKKVESKEVKEKNEDLNTKEVLDALCQVHDSFERYVKVGQESLLLEKVLNEKEELQGRYKKLLVKYDELVKQKDQQQPQQSQQQPEINDIHIEKIEKMLFRK